MKIKHRLHGKIDNRLYHEVWTVEKHTYCGTRILYLDEYANTYNTCLFLELCGVPTDLDFKQQITYYQLLVPKEISVDECKQLDIWVTR